MMGGCGFWIGLGSQTAPVSSMDGPRKPNGWSSVHRRRIRVQVWARSRTASPGETSGTP